MDNKTRVWLYARQRGDDGELALQKAKLMQVALDRGYNVTGYSSDVADTWLIFRPGLKEALRHIHAGAADALMVTRRSNISHNGNRFFYVMEKLQDSRARLIITGYDIGCAMHNTWEEMRLENRGKRKGLALPW